MSEPNADADLEHELIKVVSGEVTLVGERWASADSGRGSVLLLHGGGQTRHSWRRTGARLARSGWVSYAFDARGHGASSWDPGGDYSMSALVEDVEHIVARIGERPVIVGASVGGMTALVGQGERGDLATGLVLVDIVARPEPAGVAHIQGFLASAPNGFASLEDAAEAIAAYNPHRPRSKSVDGLRKNLRQGPDGRWRWHWDPAFLRGGNEPEREFRVERLVEAARRVTVPTLIVRGAHSDIVSDEGLAETQRLIPQARTVEVASAGHMIAGDDNDVFTARLSSFLDEVEGRTL